MVIKVDEYKTELLQWLDHQRRRVRAEINLALNEQPQDWIKINLLNGELGGYLRVIDKVEGVEDDKV